MIIFQTSLRFHGEGIDHWRESNTVKIETTTQPVSISLSRFYFVTCMWLQNCCWIITYCAVNAKFMVSEFKTWMDAYIFCTVRCLVVGCKFSWSVPSGVYIFSYILFIPFWYIFKAILVQILKYTIVLVDTMGKWTSEPIMHNYIKKMFQLLDILPFRWTLFCCYYKR